LSKGFPDNEYFFKSQESLATVIDNDDDDDDPDPDDDDDEVKSDKAGGKKADVVAGAAAGAKADIGDAASDSNGGKIPHSSSL